jgi:hypothetical protein
MIILPSAMACRYILLCLALLLAVISCTGEKPVEQKKPSPVVIQKPKPPVLSPEQRKELQFPVDLLESIERAAGVEAEPFFVTVVMQSENLKGETAFESKKLAGFSVRSAKSDDLIDSFRASWRKKGFLMFKSQKGYGSLPDIVTVVRGNSSYDILKLQGTESAHYHLDTKAIITWLKARQKEGPFMITGAGSDWIEARFIRQPKDMQAFAKKVALFAPDVLVRDTRTVDKLAERMEETNGFYLSWD